MIMVGLKLGNVEKKIEKKTYDIIVSALTKAGVELDPRGDYALWVCRKPSITDYYYEYRYVLTEDGLKNGLLGYNVKDIVKASGLDPEPEVEVRKLYRFDMILKQAWVADTEYTAICGEKRWKGIKENWYRWYYQNGDGGKNAERCTEN